jgi:hypothetical protein
MRRARVADDGSFRLAGIAVQTMSRLSSPPIERDTHYGVELMLVSAGRVQVAKVEVVSGETTEATIGRPATQDGSVLTGRVTAGGRPLPGVYVIARPDGEEGMAQTDEDGAYRIAGLSGAVDVVLYLGDPRLVDDFSIRSKAPLRLDPGSERRQDFDLPGGAVRVTVLDAVTGKPLSGGMAYARPAERDLDADRFEGFTASFGWSGRTAEDGTLLLVGLVPGHPHVVVGASETHPGTKHGDVLPGTPEAPAEVTIRVPRAP